MTSTAITTGRDEALIRSFELAYFIHPDRDLATRVATEAMNKLELAAAAQDKRLYYFPKGRVLADRTRTERFRNKVSMDEAHLLQRLVYIESEAHEKKQEQARQGMDIKEEDMVIRYIKHLVRTAIKRNSFYVTLGLSRLLHNYSTSETTEIYDFIMQDPDRVKDDYYFRKVKRRLMQELTERFGGLIRVSRVQRGEERFHPQENSTRWVDLVKECLNMFTPWNTICSLPVTIDKRNTGVAALEFKGGDPDREHAIEIKRIHSLLHPDCYSRLTQALRFDAPEQRVEVPQFALASSDSGHDRPGGDRRRPPRLSEEDILTIQNGLAEQAARRRTAVAGLLSIMVDGTERARLDLRRVSLVSLEIEEGDELIEVMSKDGSESLSLATFVVTPEEADDNKPRKASSIVIEGGQRISFALFPEKTTAGGPRGSVLEVTYQETNPFRAASLLSRQITNRIVSSRRSGPLASSPMLRPALGLGLVTLVVITLGLLFWPQPPASKPPEVAEQRQSGSTIENAPAEAPATSMEPSPHPPSIAGSGSQRKNHVPQKAVEERSDPGGEVAARQNEPEPDDVPPPTWEFEISETEATRRPRTGSNALTLADVKKLYVDFGDDDPARLLALKGSTPMIFSRRMDKRVNEHLVEFLKATERLTVVETKAEADAVLRGFLRERAGHLEISARLINASGAVLWTTTTAKQGLAGEDAIKSLAGEVVRDLLQEIDPRKPKR
ncbi:MAG: hypothetical protein HY650_02410 [Acidobacteria bacterium]|nr:hypothetical protein [Acidobacteriota bacterium]